MITCRQQLNGRPLRSPKVQEKAPEFEGTAVINDEFKKIKLSDYKGKYLVFYFYPFDFSFVCPTEIIAFSNQYEEFKKINTEVIGCSTDSHFSHLNWTTVSRKSGGIGQIKYPLLSDFTKKISRDYGVLLEDLGASLRGLFIIDGKGTIRHMSVNDLPVGRSVEEVLRLVKAFQFNDKHGEVCPASWQPDKESIKPNVKDSKTFFGNAYKDE
ncbi:FAD-dependent monooxygenase prx3 [Polyplax serrata]|uniref:thioredoxin-dependent peroxiredoxin n=1 Tax=Polyplax serrata TaxID=468196 RepID=A0ABR1B7A4_POLSC